MQQEFIQYILIYGYPAIFILIYLIEIGIPLPLPNELLLVFSGYLVSEGIINVYGLFAVAITADFLGTLTIYIIFYFAGNFLMAHKPKWFPLSDSTIDGIAQKINASIAGPRFLSSESPLLYAAMFLQHPDF